MEENSRSYHIKWMLLEYKECIIVGASGGKKQYITKKNSPQRRKSVGKKWKSD